MNRKPQLIIAMLAVIALAAVLSIVSTKVEAGDHASCVHAEFKTEMYNQACLKGGQPAAKDAAKKFNKDHQIKSCNQCHAKLAPSYELKSDGLEQFKKLGGK